MDEKVLLRIAFIGSLIGLLALYFLSEGIDYSEKTIEKINDEKIQEMFKIKGEVNTVRNQGNVTFLSIKQPSVIDVVVFDNVSINEGNSVEIIGQGEEYNGKMEVIAHRIRVIG